MDGVIADLAQKITSLAIGIGIGAAMLWIIGQLRKELLKGSMTGTVVYSIFLTVLFAAMALLIMVT